MTIFFTSDTHFGHKRILELGKGRPFKTVESMDAALIYNWNKTVGPKDTVYHLGDFAFDDHDPYLKQLHGSKLLLPGNHDNSKRLRYATGWTHVFPTPYYELKGFLEHPIILSHYAFRVWRNSGKGALHLYGHSHGNLVGDNQCCDVGVDNWEFKPASLYCIQTRLQYFMRRMEPDHHGKEKTIPCIEQSCSPEGMGTEAS